MSWSRKLVVVVLVLAAFVSTTRRARADGAGVHSPMTALMVARLRAVLARGGMRQDVFAKVGDSNSAAPAFLRCLGGNDVRLGDATPLEATRQHFTRASFTRASEAATAGWRARDVLAGALEREIAAMRPAFAVIMLGTNDNRPIGMESFEQTLGEVVDRTLALGVVPLVSTIPPRTDSTFAATRVRTLNAIVRAVAQARQVPLMDLYAALEDEGIGADGVHLDVAGTGGSPHACWFDGTAVKRGMNRRNLLVLTALDRARRFLLEHEAPEGQSIATLAPVACPRSWGTEQAAASLLGIGPRC